MEEEKLRKEMETRDRRELPEATIVMTTTASTLVYPKSIAIDPHSSSLTSALLMAVRIGCVYI